MGRTAGATNKDYDFVEASKTRCKKCKSTNRAAYFGTHRVFVEKRDDGTRTTTWKRTKCTDCGQHRFDIFVD